ncbi:MAG: response regulator [Synergistales bacterium]|nr:response regulator [Synergistales bacterium]MDY6401492.1 response regulator [Synergistales bacterium]MDY6404126.1 response regulator [Synergistales bacterium]MDY6409746.1 response regulator [Synergistales bacterium]MDY6414163.1 response regulator [Synergistales bacterium]
MTFLNNFNEIFIELAMLPYLLVFSIFLGGRMATQSEINKRFLMLVISTFIAASFEAVIELFTDMETSELYMKVFYALVNINAYSLMAYVAAYTQRMSQRFIELNFFALVVSLIMLFVFGTQEKTYMIFSPGFAVIFVLEGFILQLLFQQNYGNGQFIVMNVLFIFLIDSFIMQYLFAQNIPLVYTVATIMLVFTFFYMEAPTYRQLLTAHVETEKARHDAELSMQHATAANKTKSNFLASTSHEIRTPMNAILGINDMIINELAMTKDEESKKAAQNIRRSGNYLLTLVNNILDISKIDAGKMDLYESDYHLWDVLWECEGYTTHKLNGKNVKFSLDVDENMSEYLHGDVLRLKQALINLLDNAAKYTKAGSVTLKASGVREGDEINLSFIVQDTGLGMKEDDMTKIFEPFERANIVETRNILGAGLGLTLVKNITDIMHGEIKIESSYGEGTKVTLTLPQKIARDEEFTIKEYKDFISSNLAQQLQEALNTKTEWPDAKILIVDDTPVNLVVAKGMLKDSKAKIETAESGEEALEKIKSEHFDLIFLDHKMPGMDGIETLKQAKKYAQGTPFIALTANAGPNARNEYIAEGFDDYLPKPFKSLEMLKILKKFLI